MDRVRASTPASRRRLPEVFLWLQASALAAWWVLLFAVPGTRPLFVVDTWPEATLLAFLLPDAVLLLVGSLVVAHGLRRGAAWARTAFAIVLGAVLYATLYCIAATAVYGGGGLGAALMSLCALANTVAFRWSR